MEVMAGAACLGMAIEGGADTRQREVRIINIQAGGAAIDTAGLCVGQVSKGICKLILVKS